jgi:hypothetical protein
MSEGTWRLGRKKMRRRTTPETVGVQNTNEFLL